MERQFSNDSAGFIFFFFFFLMTKRLSRRMNPKEIFNFRMDFGSKKFFFYQSRF